VPTPSPPWLAARASHLARHPELRPILEAFPGGQHADGPRPRGLTKRIVEVLREEIDAGQAAMFGRRFAQAVELLGALEATAPAQATLLLDGLCFRMAEVLDGPAPRTLRVRALVDFYVSQVPRLQHPPGPPVEHYARRAVYRPVAPGLRLARLEGPCEAGPLRAHVLRGRPRIRCLDARPRTDLVALAAEEGAVAAVSGGFFLYSEHDIAPPSQRTDPVGLLVTDGIVHGPPWFPRGALVQGPRGLDVRVVRPEEARLEGMPLAPYTRARGLHGPNTQSTAIVGRYVIAHGAQLPVPLAGAVLEGHYTHARIELPGVEQAMGGGPMLVADNGGALDLAAEGFARTAPPVTFSQDETFDHNLLPRLAAGVTTDGELVLAAIDGRHLERAPGLTLRQTARLMAALGCIRAVNLDGGSSKRMVVQGRVVDQPTTELVVAGAPRGPVRPVHSAVLLYAAPRR